MTVSEDLPTLESLRSPALGDNPYLRRMQAEKSIWRVRTATGDEGWLVLGHAEIKQLMVDRRLGRTHPNPDQAAQATKNPIFELIASTGAGSDPHEMHQQVRALLIPYFTSKRMKALRPGIERIVHEAVDELLASNPPVDLQPAFSLPVPLRVLCELMGVPEDERDHLAVLLDGMHGTGENASADGAAAFFAYLSDLVDRKRADPGDDLISGICPELENNQLVVVIVCLLLFAGHESIATHIGNGMARLLTRPDLREAVLSDQDLMNTAVEEMLRTANFGGGWQPHYALENIEMCGERISAGDLVLPDFAMANFDPRSFEDPERVDFHRTPNPHLTFAHGAWYCIGAPLARLELNIAFTALLTRIPTMRLTVDPEELTDPEKVKKRLSATLAWLPVAW
ncbi:cytochrome P450 [Amycolatopsis cihanbeyliensis]|uniref:Cytochrome P450 monooxygenase n=1 Tax=Amycolatopsis cihanbeyliensis TaxID=1128664 RepID=A0A542CS50_AMYCI|nr:cytochrome P450 [Amycolatopsis cihanbeyliensis]TQI93656.1 cytochrome P450 monooxygenase [Amycolatopsis cihanbeyliensis]